MFASSPLLRAQTEVGFDFNLEAQPLDSSLQAVARTAGKEVMYSLDAIAGRRAGPLKGHLALDAALERLLRGTGLAAEVRDDAILIRNAEQPGRRKSNREGSDDIIVTGSHIRGSELTSPVTVTSREQMERRGFNDLGSFARSLVQNYSGGQNATLAGTGQGTSTNITGSSALNLRGLGSDATLTLFNGHRVAYDGMDQGIDISSIPLAAIERMDVVTDGSSALYGSDAVAGVANVVLRRDFDGAVIGARIGAATDGGDVEQQYNIVTGKRWSSGGVMVALDYRHTTPITAGQRSYLQNIYPTATVIGGYDQYSAVLAGHQQLTDRLTFEIDGSFSDRKNIYCTNFTATAPCQSSGNDISLITRSWSVSPVLKLELDGGWQFRLSGTVSGSRTNQRASSYFGGALSQRQRAIYDNRLTTLDLGADGTVMDLPGGPARLAVGLGLRSASFNPHIVALDGDTEIPFFVFSEKQETYYAYGEVSLPLIGPDNAVPFIDRLSVSGAVRYEDTPHIGRLATPKVGLIYAPSPDVAFKFSWGKSFKAPRLWQLGQPTIGYSGLGSTYLPESPTAGTVLQIEGGNPGLKPEKATSWTATVSLTPRFIDGLHIDASYFRVRYRDRVVSPIPNTGSSFASVYSDYVTLNPTRAQVLAAIASVPTLYDTGGGDVTTANVVAIIANYLQNAAVQRIEGVDIAADYRFSLSPRDIVQINAAASYLTSDQQISATQPVTQLAGVIFRPPHWRAQGSVDWAHDNVSLTGAFNFIGGSLDNRLVPYFRVGSLTSVDTVARVKTTDAGGPFANLGFTLSILNIFNAKPSFARTTSASGYQFDSTNFSSIGRFVSLSITTAF